MFRRAFLTGLVAMAGASAARADEQVYFEGPKTVELPLKYSQVDGKLYLVGQVNGRDLTFFIDTGATSIIDINLAKDLGLEQVATNEKGYGLNGGVSDRVRSRITLQLGKLKLTGAPVDLVDLAKVKALARQYGAPEYDGLIGAELLQALKARIDYGKLTLTLTRPG